MALLERKYVWYLWKFCFELTLKRQIYDLCLFLPRNSNKLNTPSLLQFSNPLFIVRWRRSNIYLKSVEIFPPFINHDHSISTQKRNCQSARGNCWMAKGKRLSRSLSRSRDFMRVVCGCVWVWVREYTPTLAHSKSFLFSSDANQTTRTCRNKSFPQTGEVSARRRRFLSFSPLTDLCAIWGWFLTICIGWLQHCISLILFNWLFSQKKYVDLK